MKKHKIFILIFFLILIISCGYPEYDRPWYDIDYEKPEKYKLENAYNIFYYVTEIINYKTQNLVHHPQYYIDIKEADCVGISLISLGIAYKELKIKGSLLKYNVEGSGRLETHICFKINGKIYNKELARGYCTNLICEIPFDDIELAYRFLF